MVRQFQATFHPTSNGGGYVELPFNPTEAWGAKDRHHVNGMVGGMTVRGPLTLEDGAWRLALGPAWLRDHPIAPGDSIAVTLSAEGPQRSALAPDLAAALDAEPEAGAFFDALATFYRKGYLKWLDGASRRPELRKQRIQEWVRLLKAHQKTRERNGP
ncbi:MAG: YdeI/OmpD-associated family protein [Actinomycetota bacterium]